MAAINDRSENLAQTLFWLRRAISAERRGDTNDLVTFLENAVVFARAAHVAEPTIDAFVEEQRQVLREKLARKDGAA